MSGSRRVIPIRPASDDAHAPDAEGACSGSESFALRVIGDSMAPEFDDGDIIIIEPDGLAADGAFVLAHVNGEWTFRQLVATSAAWELRALAPGYPRIPLPDLSSVRGVVIQKSKPGRRSATRRYGPA